MKALKAVIVLFFIFGTQAMYSAPAPPPAGGTTGSPGCWPPPCVPIDGGIVFLMVAAALFGAYKIYTQRKSSQSIS